MADAATNEDWLRSRSWDLPRSLEPYLASVCPNPGEPLADAVRRHLELPSAAAMPTRLRLTVEQWLAKQPMVAAGDFNEDDHPRGHGGKFVKKDDDESVGPVSDVRDGVATDSAKAIVEKWALRSAVYPRSDGVLTRDELVAVEKYTEKWTGESVNDSLRHGRELDEFSAIDSGEKDVLVALVDSAIEKRTFDEDTSLYRGMTTRHDFEVGETFTDKGYVSTSADRFAAEDFASGPFGGPQWSEDDKTPVLMTIGVPAGEHYAYGFQGLEEKILARDTTFRVTEVGPKPRLGATDESQEITVEVVRR